MAIYPGFLRNCKLKMIYINKLFITYHNIMLVIPIIYNINIMKNLPNMKQNT